METADELVFDEWIEVESGDRAYICEIHEEFLNPMHPELLDTEDKICGVEGCYNIASFIILLDEEESDA